MNQKANNFMNITIEDCEKFNREYDENREKYRYTECSKYDLGAMEKWIRVRNNLEYTEDTSGGKWERLTIKQFKTKYGINYIYIDPERKLWRYMDSASEFYGAHVDEFDFEKFLDTDITIRYCGKEYTAKGRDFKEEL